MELHEDGWRDMDWNAFQQDRDRLWAVDNAVMNIRVP
jgi:hypothetical protein